MSSKKSKTNISYAETCKQSQEKAAAVVKTEKEEVEVHSNIVTQIKAKQFKTKSQFISIFLSVIFGFFAAHDWYLGLKKRALLKYGLLVLSVVTCSILFSTVTNESELSFNFIFQTIMMAPMLAYVLWWSYDFISLGTKKARHFKAIAKKGEKKVSKKGKK